MKQSLNFFIFIVLLGFGCLQLNAQDINLTISGSNTSETTVIDSLFYKNTFINLKSLNEEINLMHSKLQRIGYIESELKKIKKINDSVYESSFNLKQKFYTIYIYYDKNLISRDLIKSYSLDYTDTYFTLPIPEIESTLQRLNSEITNQGLPFSTFKIEGIEKKDTFNLQGELLIDNNSERTVDHIIVKGYEKFPKSYITHFLKIKPKELFNLNNIKSKTERLNDLSFSNQAKSPEVLFTKDSTTIYLYLNKTKSNAFDGFLGFGTNETTNKLEFDGYLNLNLINNFNYGEQFELTYKSDENEQKRFNVNLTLPYVFTLPLGAELGLNIFKKDSSFTTVNQKANLFYQINSKHRLHAGINSVQSNDLLDQQIGSTIKDYNSTFYKVRHTFRRIRTNDLMFPIDFQLDTSVGFGNRKSNINQEQQVETQIIATKILNLDNKNSLYIGASGKALISDSYFTNELFRFGGINSIRGFEENSLLASYYGLINLEYRYRLNSGIYIHTISDGAYFENKITKSKEKLFGFGFGFGIITKAGLLKLNYANGKSENQNFKLSNSKIHLSLNAIF